MGTTPENPDDPGIDLIDEWLATRETAGATAGDSDEAPKDPAPGDQPGEDEAAPAAGISTFNTDDLDPLTAPLPDLVEHGIVEHDTIGHDIFGDSSPAQSASSQQADSPAPATASRPAASGHLSDDERRERLSRMVKNRLASKEQPRGTDAPTSPTDDVPEAASSHVIGGRLPKLEPRAANTDWQRALFNPSDLAAPSEPGENGYVEPASEPVATSDPEPSDKVSIEAEPTDTGPSTAGPAIGSIEWQRNLFGTPDVASAAPADAAPVEELDEDSTEDSAEAAATVPPAELKAPGTDEVVEDDEPADETATATTSEIGPRLASPNSFTAVETGEKAFTPAAPTDVFAALRDTDAPAAEVDTRADVAGLKSPQDEPAGTEPSEREHVPTHSGEENTPRLSDAAIVGPALEAVMHSIDTPAKPRKGGLLGRRGRKKDSADAIRRAAQPAGAEPEDQVPNWLKEDAARTSREQAEARKAAERADEVPPSDDAPEEPARTDAAAVPVPAEDPARGELGESDVASPDEDNSGTTTAGEVAAEPTGFEPPAPVEEPEVVETVEIVEEPEPVEEPVAVETVAAVEEPEIVDEPQTAETVTTAGTAAVAPESTTPFAPPQTPTLADVAAAEASVPEPEVEVAATESTPQPEGAPTAETPVVDIPTEDTPVEDAPAEDAPSARAPATDEPAADAPTAETGTAAGSDADSPSEDSQPKFETLEQLLAAATAAKGAERTISKPVIEPPSAPVDAPDAGAATGDAPETTGNPPPPTDAETPQTPELVGSAEDDSAPSPDWTPTATPTAAATASTYASAAPEADVPEETSTEATLDPRTTAATSVFAAASATAPDTKPAAKPKATKAPVDKIPAAAPKKERPQPAARKPKATKSPQPAKAEKPARTSATEPFPTTINLTPQKGTQRFLGTLLLFALMATLLLGWLAWDTRETTYIAYAATAALLTLILWGAHSTAEPAKVVCERGLLDIRSNDSHHRFDLASPYTRIEVVGRPGRRGWKVLILRKSMPPYVINDSLVDPHEFTRILDHYESARNRATH